MLENSSIHLTQIQQLEMNTERIIKIEWSIKGYHAFRIKPHSQIELDVLPEEGNPFSQYATKVVMPLLQEISPDLHNVSTDMREENHQRGQLMKDIAGLFMLLLLYLYSSCTLPCLHLPWLKFY